MGMLHDKHVQMQAESGAPRKEERRWMTSKPPAVDRRADYWVGQDLLGAGLRRLTWPLGSAETASESFGWAEAVFDESFPLRMSVSVWTVVSGSRSTWQGEGGGRSQQWCTYSY
jgi:hypothetical protein